MKRFMIAIGLGLMLMSCGNGATDQDATTDTTTMPVDPSVNADTANQINRNYGTQIPDSTLKK